MFAVNSASRFINNHKSHWQAVKRIIRYLIGTTNLKIEYEMRDSEVSKRLIGYSDSAYASNLGDQPLVTDWFPTTQVI